MIASESNAKIQKFLPCSSTASTPTPALLLLELLPAVLRSRALASKPIRPVTVQKLPDYRIAAIQQMENSLAPAGDVSVFKVGVRIPVV